MGEVFSVNDLMDYGRFRQALDGKKSVTILGGGLIGCEFANDLSNGGFQVSLVEPLGRCLPMLLPEAASAAVGRGLESLGVEFHFGPWPRRCTTTATAKGWSPSCPTAPI